MNKKTGIFCKTLVVIGVLCILGIYPILAQSGEPSAAKPVADEMIGSSGITWVTKINYAQLVLTVSRPDGSVFTKTFSSGSSPYLDLSTLVGNRAADGSYTYELRVIPSNITKVRREGEIETAIKGKGVNIANDLIQSGHFLVQGGSIVTPTGTEVTALDSSKDDLSRTQDLCYQDDMVIQYSLCVGVDCVCNMNFGFDTIVLRENNLRIFFDDTSTSSGFPYNDWRIICNDSASGGANYFSVEDATAGRRTFSIEAGAPAHSLYVDDGGRIGFGTSTPSQNLHLRYCNTPTLRLDQDSSCGWAPQAWDVAGNEANFFIRDVTNGSKLPFRIQPSTPSNTLCLRSTGYVGIGTWSPEYPLEVETTGENAAIVCDRTDGAKNFMSSTDSYGQFGTVSDHPTRIMVKSIWKMQLNSDKSLSMASGASCTAGGTWTNSSSRALKENIQSLDTEEALNTINNLNPVKFNYKVDKAEKHVGFIAEDAPELVATTDRKGMSPMDVAAVLTKVVQEQQKFIQAQQKINAELQQKIAELEKK